MKTKVFDDGGTLIHLHVIVESSLERDSVASFFFAKKKKIYKLYIFIEEKETNELVDITNQKGRE